tara:strand:- start:203 stop:784 length:582 start_codon:yes stop_codon:yes gene_type:complete
MENINYNLDKSLLDIGTTPSLNDMHNVILTKTQDNNNITCLSDQDCNILKSKFTNVKNFLKVDGKNTNLKNESFDIVYSNAVIEHVGSFENQIKFIRECVRLSKSEVFITTPNRFFPFDFHTKIPLLHMLPKSLHRKILKFIGLGFYANEKNLNLLSKSEIVKICDIIQLKNYRILELKITLLTSNLILIIRK